MDDMNTGATVESVTLTGSDGTKTDLTDQFATAMGGTQRDRDRAEQMGGATREKLRSFVARIERLEAEKAEYVTDIRELYSEIKSFGFDTKVMRKLITLRKQDVNERAEQEALLDLYVGALDD